MMTGPADNGCCEIVSPPFFLYRSVENQLYTPLFWGFEEVRKEGLLTKNSSGRIITGETGFAHTRTGANQPSPSLYQTFACCCRAVVSRSRRLQQSSQQQSRVLGI